MTKCILVKDYLYKGRHAIGVLYDIYKGTERYILDDCDVYSLIQLRCEEGYEVFEFDDKIIKVLSASPRGRTEARKLK